MTDHIPFSARGRSLLRQQRAVDRGWWDAEHTSHWDESLPRDGSDAPATPPLQPSAESATWSAALPAWPGAHAKPAKRAGGPHQLPMAVVVILTLLSLIVGFLGTQGILRGVDVLTAGLDAKMQVTSLEAIARSGDYFHPAALAQMQAELQALDSDILRIQADVPVGVLGTRGAEITHAFNMASDLIRAGEYGVDAGQIMVPHIKGMLTNLDTSTTASNAASASSTVPPLTLADIQRVSADVNAAGTLAEAALVERAQIKDSDLQAIGAGSVVHILDKLDAIAPKLPKYLYYAKLGIAALPSLLGITGPAHYLLFDQDSDELRPTGGFLGNYALLTMSGGKLVSGVHLQDIYSLDCPGPGGYPSGCKNVVMPAKFSWMDAGGDQYFGVRDSNLDSNFPTSAHYIEQNYHLETGQTADGVIAFTPALIGKILDIIGGLEVPGYNVKVTSANLQDTIHYFHILYAYCVLTPNGKGDPRCAQLANGSKISDKKAFDATLGSTLLHAVASMSPAVQGKIVKAALDALTTRDLQIYFNDPQVESILSTFHVDESLPPVQNDQIAVVDSNVNANYANADVQEHISDNVTINADGSASHDMTITYLYPYVKHPYDSIYTQTTLSWTYVDVVRVLVPDTSQLDTYPQCGDAYAISTTEPNRSVWTCFHVTVYCNARNYDGSDNGATPVPVTLEFQWTVPKAVLTTGSTSQYNLTLVHQAGTQPAVTVTIHGPNGATLTPTAASAPLAKSAGGLEFGGATGTSITQDVNLSVSYRS